MALGKPPPVSVCLCGPAVPGRDTEPLIPCPSPHSRTTHCPDHPGWPTSRPPAGSLHIRVGALDGVRKQQELFPCEAATFLGPGGSGAAVSCVGFWVGRRGYSRLDGPPLTRGTTSWDHPGTSRKEVGTRAPAQGLCHAGLPLSPSVDSGPRSRGTRPSSCPVKTAERVPGPPGPVTIRPHSHSAVALRCLRPTKKHPFILKSKEKSQHNPTCTVFIFIPMQSPNGVFSISGGGRDPRWPKFMEFLKVTLRPAPR